MVTFMAISKAYDCVNYYTLLKKLDVYEVRRNVND